MSFMMKTGIALVAFYVAVVVAAWLGQRRLMYHPDARRVAPAQAGLSMAREREIVTPDGQRLVAWQIDARPGQPTILYFHGNAGNLTDRAARASRYAAVGYGFFIVSYRGYGGSTGRPSEANNIADARLAYDRLVSEGVPPSMIVVYGESLGSGVAVQLAAARKVAAVILDAPYTSMIEMALLRYPFLPARHLLLDRYDSKRHIKDIAAPVLVLHGERDTVIPVAMGQALHAAAGEPKHIVIFPHGRHTDLDDYGAVAAVRQWLVAHRIGR
ncbi:MAG: alpha/beta hydrolase [Hyphomicrobiaceae bacterium]